MAKVAQQLPHYGIKNGYVRTGKRCEVPAQRDGEGRVITQAIVRDFTSISAAKHFMRVGD